MSDSETMLLGRLAVHYKLITPQQASLAVHEQGKPGEERKFGEILLGLGFISAEQLKWLLEARDKYMAQRAGASAAAKSPAATPSSPTPVAARPVASPATAQTSAAAPRGVGLAEILQKAVQVGASDIHVHAQAPLLLRRGGKLSPLRPGVLTAEESERLVCSVLDVEQQARLKETWELDFAFALPGIGRFRANVYKQQRGFDGVFRAIPPKPPTLEQLQLPSILAKLTTFHQGLVLLTGPSGCGKSSTLAALVNLINEDREDHILTVEDPIEYVHVSKRAVVNQRQAQKHTATFGSALKAALREDPDVIVIGELRDLETISLAISAAETGHLVLATLHTNSAIRTINRILDVFPPKQQPQVRAMVSESLRAVVTQKLVATADGERRVPATEVLFVKSSVSNLIRDQKTFQIRSVMQTGRADGMCLMDDSLLELVKAGTITKDEARRHAEDPKRFA